MQISRSLCFVVYQLKIDDILNTKAFDKSSKLAVTNSTSSRLARIVSVKYTRASMIETFSPEPELSWSSRSNLILFRI